MRVLAIACLFAIIYNVLPQTITLINGCKNNDMYFNSYDYGTRKVLYSEKLIGYGQTFTQDLTSAVNRRWSGCFYASYSSKFEFPTAVTCLNFNFTVGSPPSDTQPEDYPQNMWISISYGGEFPVDVDPQNTESPSTINEYCKEVTHTGIIPQGCQKNPHCVIGNQQRCPVATSYIATFGCYY